MKVNAKLWEAIKSRGLMQQDLARIVGDDPSVVSRIVNGIWNPDEARKIRYARALGVRVDQLFGE
jgi:transcriptional regulator with XRE-family HTH domain